MHKMVNLCNKQSKKAFFFASLSENEMLNFSCQVDELTIYLIVF